MLHVVMYFFVSQNAEQISSYSGGYQMVDFSFLFREGIIQPNESGSETTTKERKKTENDKVIHNT